MNGLSELQITLSLVAFALLLLVTRAAAELARRFGQPEVLGELLGGFLLGPSVLGGLFPGTFHSLFGNQVVAQGMSLLSWIGAILLLLIAGLEADLLILRQKAVPGLLSAAGAIGSSLVFATWVAVKLMHRAPSNSLLLGLVYSVTAVSVVAKLLIERSALRRDYAQVMLAAGIASEVLVWPFLSVLTSIHERSNPWIAGLRSGLLAVAFFALMLTVGRRFTFWAMRRVADATAITNGELSLILLLVCVSGTITAAIGLHPLLGAFVFGVLLSRAPRATVALKGRIQALTVSFFAPIFFGLAGMRVDLFKLHTGSLGGILLLLFLVGSLKILFGFGAARLGRLPFWEAASIGVGLNLKGGSDVVVAIVGVELGLLSQDLYTLYAVVAILTVLLTPPVLARLAERAQPSQAEVERLNHEEARRRAYFADMERVLVPMVAEFRPELAASLVEQIAYAKSEQNEIFDVTELAIEADTTLTRGNTVPELVDASNRLARASEQPHVQLQQMLLHEATLPAILDAAKTQQIVFAGVPEADADSTLLSFGASHDALLCDAPCDVLLAVHKGATLPRPGRILVPVNGLEHSLAAADLGAYIARSINAELVLFNVARATLDMMFWKEAEHRDLLQAGYTIVREAQFRVARLGARQSTRVQLGADPGYAIIEELGKRRYGMIVLGATSRASAGGLSLGGTVEHVVRNANIPRLLLLSRGTESGV